MNPTLFTTSCIMLAGHLILVLCFSHSPLPLLIMYVLGPLTSVWNHGTTSEIAKWSDRCVMTIGLGVDLWFICRLSDTWPHITMVVLFLSWALALYFGGKVFMERSDNADAEEDILESMPHAIALICILASHVCLMVYYKDHYA
jgi:hypothetical protein